MLLRDFRVVACVAALLCSGSATLTAAAAESFDVDQIPELAPVALCAFEVGSTLKPIIDVHAPTLSQQVAQGVAATCPLDALKAATAQLNLPAEEHEDLGAAIAFAIRKSAWRGYFEANPLTERPLHEGSFGDGDNILTFVRPPGFSDGEIVEVSTSEVGKEREIPTLRGVMDGFGYSRQLDSSGSIGWGRQSYGQHFKIGCSPYINFGDLCTIEAAALAGRNSNTAFTAVFDGKTGRPIRLCASFFYGQHETSIVEVTVSLDDKVIVFDLTTACAEDPMGALTDAIRTAHLVTSRVRYEGETRAHVYQTTSKGFVEARELLSRLLEAGRPGPERSSILQAFEYADRRAPQTEDDVVAGRSDWGDAADCVAVATSPELDCLRVLDEARKHWPETGSEWVTIGDEISGFQPPPKVDLDRIDRDQKLETGWADPKFAKRVANLKAEGERRRRGVRPLFPYAVALGQNERESVLEGRPARAGFSHHAAYAYTISTAAATAVVARLFLPRENMQSIVVTCERSAAPACEIHLRMEDGAGELVIHTNGDPWNSHLCLGAGAVPQGPLAITGESNAWPAPLDETHCAGRFDTGTIVAEGDELVLIAGDPGHRRQLAWCSQRNVDVAFDLARYLSTRLKSARR